jgi:hypothetical protein
MWYFFSNASIWKLILRSSTNIIPVKHRIWDCVVSVLSYNWEGRLHFDSLQRQGLSFSLSLTDRLSTPCVQQISGILIVKLGDRGVVTLIVYQYSETNVMQLLFSLLRIKGLYMFRALLAHPQKALNKRHLIYCVHVMSVGCTRLDWNGVPLQS